MSNNFVPVHPDRKTTVVLNDHLPSPVNPWTAIERDASQMAQGSLAEIVNVHYIPGVGWQMRAQQYDPGKTHELSGAQAGILPLSAWQASADAVEYDTFRQSGLTGVTYDGTVQSAGSPFMSRRVAASGSWSAGLTADQAAFGKPDTSQDTVPMDRFAVLQATDYEPDDALFYRFYVPGSSVLNSGPVITLYFNGPAGHHESDSPLNGTGRYALKLFGDATAWLFEMLSDNSTWVIRYAMKWCESKQRVYDALHFVAIYNDCDFAPPWKGTTLHFQFGTVAGFGQSVIESVFRASFAPMLSYTSPQQSGTTLRVGQAVSQPPVTKAPLRIDMRRDMRVQIQTAVSTYPETGTLYDDVISLPYYPVGSNKFALEFYGNIPSGCNLDARMYDADTGVELSGRVLVSKTARAVFLEYSPNTRQRRYRIKFTFTSNGARNRTPTLTRWNLYRASEYETPSVATVNIPDRDAAPALAKTDLTRVDITGPTIDNTIDSAGLEVVDYNGSLPFSGQTGQPVRIEVEYNSSGDKTDIFRGYIERASGSPIKGDDTGRHGAAPHYLDFSSRHWRVQCTGEFQRLQEALCPERYTWFDENANQLFKVTDAVDILLTTSYPAANISVPDIDVRLFNNNNDALVTEPGSRVGETCTKFLRDYLGAYLVWDNSVGTDGKWRVLEQKRGPNYNYLVRFDTRHPGAGKLAHVEAAYGTSTNGSQTVTHTYIKHGTLSHFWEKPEGNHIMVIGGAAGIDGGKAGSAAARLSQIAINVDSYDAMGVGAGNPGYPDPTNPDYIGRMVPIYYVDSSLATQKAVDWVCRRIYDYAAHARHIMTFEAPLTLVTDVNDAEQLRPRPLRFYDFVQVYWEGSWQTFIVLECNPIYTKDKFQFARYTLVRPSNIDTVGVLRRGQSPWERFMKAAQMATGSMAVNGVGFSGNIGLRTSASGLVVLPEPSADPLQELDPAQPGYGAFNFMADYDPIL